MNRLISTNLEQVRPDRLPPERRQGPVRMLFLSTVFLGFRRYHEQLLKYAGEDPEVDAVHVELVAPLWQRVVGKCLPLLGRSGWDQHAYRHLVMWRWRIRRWLRGALPVERFDVVHIMTQGAAWALVDMKRESRARFATNIDATAVQDYRELGFARMARLPLLRAERQMYESADLVVCRNRWCSESLMEDFGVPAEKIAIARNSMHVPPHSRADHPSRAAGERVRIVFVGNDFERKGGPQLLRLHQERWAERAELHVCSARAKPDHTARNVVWHGSVPNETLRNELLPTMDISVMPTRNDMHPWAILESAAAGLPVVASRLAGIPEMVVDGVNGFLCGVGDWTGFAEAVERLLSDGALRERMGRAGRAHVKQDYDPDGQFGGLISRLKALAE